ncbi:LOW QUALITY PROTEIN: zymogen granule membrane protein 16-like [Maylandia zebra]|uniref:LOW QUALITY PROTEIN: zymogen granule membrane protein 16-like n=1 Tax=Maylandia zebra TaxID=106582 RepID=UPI00403CB3B4
MGNGQTKETSPLRYHNSWADVVGRIYGTPQELELFDGEAVDQLFAYILDLWKIDNNYIYQVIFGTSRGRSLIVSQPTQGSFNFYPPHPDAELRLLSRRLSGNGITSLGAHWGVLFIY